jgi:hypothetical protein
MTGQYKKNKIILGNLFRNASGIVGKKRMRKKTMRAVR